MLTRVLALLAEGEGGLGTAEISRRLDIAPGVLEGMLETLVRRGRLVRVCAAETPCGACALRSECNLLAGPGTRYVVAPRRVTQVEE
ncbi:MAG: helix-turn-helix domain-containing protein [Anaerolineales bacterium]|nr:helix-turn-helix domain-containing protein [Anaerolineales bacterium]